MMRGRLFAATLLLTMTLTGLGQNCRADEVDDQAIVAAFATASSGFSSDELLLQDSLRDAFFVELAGQGEPLDAQQQRAALLRLLALRKAGKLKVKTTRRGQSADRSAKPSAEIAARVVMDRHRVSSDYLLADTALRSELQAEAEKISPGIDPYQIRKSVLQLRKQRALRPELVLQVADWQRVIQTFALQELRGRLKREELPSAPGVYLFRSADGYLYVGEASDLAKRLGEHLGGSDRKSLANYLLEENSDAEVSVELHIFPADSPARKVTVRRAYESELIRSRKPRFNVRP